MTLVVPNREWESYFLRQHEKGRAIGSLLVGGLSVGDPFPWHFTVLEDVGVDIPAVPPPPPIA